MTGENNKGGGGFSGLNNLVTSLEKTVRGEEGLAERVARGESRQADVASEVEKPSKGAKSLIPQSLLARAALALAFIAALSSLWWWPLAINVRDDWRIQSAESQIESLDKELWQKSKKGSDPTWTIRLSGKLLYGQSDRKLKDVGVILLERLANSGNFQAANNLSNYYADEKDGVLDNPASAKWKKISQNLLEEQAKQGSAPAMWALAEMHSKGVDVELNVKRAHELFFAAAEKDPAEFGEKIGRFFRDGSTGFDQSYSDAFAWFKKAASAGNGEVKSRAAGSISGLTWRARERGVSAREIKSWEAEAARIYIDAANAGIPYAMYRVADGMLSEDPHYFGTTNEGATWLKKAVDAEESNAMVLMALLSADSKKPIPSNVEDLLLRAWKTKSSDQDSKKSSFIEDIWGDVLLKLGIFSADGNRLVGTHDPVRFYGWLNAHAELRSERRDYRFANLAEAKLADQLTDQILFIANSNTLPKEWPRLTDEGSAAKKFIPFDGELDKAVVSKPANGYLKGEKQSFAGGLSSFTIDNTTGGNDAEVRLYLNGSQVRSMFVRVGTKFTAEKLAPGTYKMRYKITANGKPRVYEAKEQFVLSETKTENGTRFSRMTVTLFTVKDGNMQTEEVPLDRF